MTTQPEAIPTRDQCTQAAIQALRDVLGEDVWKQIESRFGAAQPAA